MHYWDADRPEWTAAHRDFAAGWRKQKKWVVSKTLTSAGPNATLISGGLEAALRRIQAEHSGEIEVGGPALAQHLGELGLIDEYWLYLHPVVLGGGTPFFKGPRPPLRLLAQQRIGDNAIKLTYSPG